MYERNLKKLWNGLASLRDYEFDLAIERNGLKFIYGNKVMTITLDELKSKKFQCHSREFDSKYNPRQKYTLYDFKFIDDNERIKKIEKEITEEIPDEIEEERQEALL